MDLQKRSAGFGAAMLIFSLLLRLADGAMPGYAVRPEPEESLRLPVFALSAPAATRPPALPPSTQRPTTVAPAVPPATTLPPMESIPPGLTFSEADVEHLQLRVSADCPYYPDLIPLLLQPLDWQLNSGEPTVLIYHSHATESYTREPGQTYTEQAHCRTTDPDYNMVAVGQALAELLTSAGICVLHDRQLHDYPVYSGAYANSGRSVADYLAQYPSIRLVLDLHRDAAVSIDGGDYAPCVEVDGQTAARLMLVVGTDAKSGNHPNWQENLALALKLQVLLEKRAPGITRPSILRGSRYNQEQASGALLIEMGASGNTLSQVFAALPALADAIIALQTGANREIGIYRTEDAVGATIGRPPKNGTFFGFPEGK